MRVSLNQLGLRTVSSPEPGNKSPFSPTATPLPCTNKPLGPIGSGKTRRRTGSGRQIGEAEQRSIKLTTGKNSI